MLLDSVWNLLGWHASPAGVPPPAVAPVPSLIPDAALAEDDDPVWSSARISVAEALWGEGFLFPGGGAEMLHLATPLGLSAASSLLLIGAGSGGPPRCIAEEFGVWVTGYEANARLVELANERSKRAGLGRRAQVEPWDPLAPKFARRYFHHGIAIEPLRGAAPEPLLAATSLALKPGGQFVLLEVVSDLPLDPADPMVATWARLDNRPARAPSELEITEVLGRHGFDVRIVEDLSRRDMQNAMQGWRTAVTGHGRRATVTAAGRRGGARGGAVAGALPPDADGQAAACALERDRARRVTASGQSGGRVRLFRRTCHCEFTAAGGGRSAVDETEVGLPRIGGCRHSRAKPALAKAGAGTQSLLITHLRPGSRLRECNPIPILRLPPAGPKIRGRQGLLLGFLGELVIPQQANSRLRYPFPNSRASGGDWMTSPCAGMTR